MKAISLRRAACVRAIETLRGDKGDATSFVQKARQLLLSRYWSKADLREREEILNAVEWLLRMDRNAANLETSPDFAIGKFLLPRAATSELNVR
jgi:hypothetical protein